MMHRCMLLDLNATKWSSDKSILDPDTGIVTVAAASSCCGLCWCWCGHLCCLWRVYVVKFLSTAAVCNVAYHKFVQIPHLTSLRENSVDVSRLPLASLYSYLQVTLSHRMWKRCKMSLMLPMLPAWCPLTPLRGPWLRLESVMGLSPSGAVRSAPSNI